MFCRRVNGKPQFIELYCEDRGDRVQIAGKAVMHLQGTIRSIHMVQISHETPEEIEARLLRVIAEADFTVYNGNAIIFSPSDGIFIPPGEEHEHKGRVLTDKVKAILVEDV
ncbi:MAG: hypothetical protein ACYSWZ_24590 [Planctomycetota bacterium]